MSVCIGLSWHTLISVPFAYNTQTQRETLVCSLLCCSLVFTVTCVCVPQRLVFVRLVEWQRCGLQTRLPALAIPYTHLAAITNCSKLAPRCIASRIRINTRFDHFFTSPCFCPCPLLKVVRWATRLPQCCIQTVTRGT